MTRVVVSVLCAFSFASVACADERLVDPDVWIESESPFLGSDAYFSPERRPFFQLVLGTTLAPLAQSSQAEFRWASEYVEVQAESSFVRDGDLHGFHLHASVGYRLPWGAAGGQLGVFRAPAMMEYPIVRDPIYVGAGPYMRVGDLRGLYFQSGVNYQKTTHDGTHGFALVLSAQVPFLRLRNFSLDVTGRLWLSLYEHLYAAGLVELRATFRGVVFGIGWRPITSLGVSIGYTT